MFDFKKADVKAIDKAIVSIRNRGAKFDQDIQTVGLACLVQVQAHGNVTPLNSLYKALPKGTRSTAFALWAQKHGGVTINDDSKQRKDVPLMYVDAKLVDIEAAMAEPWHKVKTEPTLGEVLDVEKAVDGLIRRLSKAKATTNPELVKALVALRATPAKKAGPQRAENAPVLPALPSQIN